MTDSFYFLIFDTLRLAAGFFITKIKIFFPEVSKLVKAWKMLDRVIISLIYFNIGISEHKV